MCVGEVCNCMHTCVPCVCLHLLAGAKAEAIPPTLEAAPVLVDLRLLEGPMGVGSRLGRLSEGPCPPLPQTPSGPSSSLTKQEAFPMELLVKETHGDGARGGLGQALEPANKSPEDFRQIPRDPRAQQTATCEPSHGIPCSVQQTPGKCIPQRWAPLCHWIVGFLTIIPSLLLKKNLGECSGPGERRGWVGGGGPLLPAGPQCLSQCSHPGKGLEAQESDPPLGPAGV